MAIETSSSEGIATVRVKRTHVHNALDRATLGELLQGVEAALSDGDTRILVLAGGEDAFSTGDDLREAAGARTAHFWAHIDAFQRLTAILRRSDVPTIASIAGYAYGGGLEIAVCCDARVAAENARFACPEVAWGLTPTNASSVLLRRLIGDGWARELLMFGRTLDAREAERIGLVTQVAGLDELEECTRALARGAARASRRALASTKRLLNRDEEDWLQDVLAAEAAAVMKGFDSDDARMRLQAFVDGRETA
jgi:enoyl-CoA hydratase/carnithine racemase